MTNLATDNALYKAAVDELDERSFDDPNWLASLRSAASEQFRVRGLPTAKDESWRFTQLRSLVGIPFVRATDPGANDDAGQALVDLGGHRVSVVAGNPILAGTNLPPGVRVLGLRDELSRGNGLIERHLGRIATTEDGFSALNAASFDGGLLVVVQRNTKLSEPIHLAYRSPHASEPSVSYPRTLVVVEPGAEVHLVETRTDKPSFKHLDNSVTEIALGDNAGLRHTWIVEGTEETFTRCNLAVRQERDSRYDSHVFSFGGSLTRLDLSVLLAAPGAECSLDGAYMARDREHVDHHTCVVHAVENATSRQKYKGVLDETGAGVFDGTVIVRRGAMATEAHQENRNLVLSEDATVHTKPHLEIDADDVRCSHGATVGRLDPQHLFYLRTRGIDERTARATLAFAFATELAERVPSATIQRFLTNAILSRLQQGDLVREVLS